MKKILYTAVVAMMLASCQNEANDLPMGNYPEDGVVRISTQVNAVQTRADGTSDYTGTDLSLSIESANSTYSYTNIEWTTTDNGATWTTDSQMLWEGANKTASIYAYAPYVASATDITAVPFTIDTDQATNGTASSDLLGFTQTAFNPFNQLNVKQAVDITFDHILSKLTLTLSLGNQFDNTVTVSSVKLVGTNTAVSYNAKDKEVAAATSAVVAPISMQKVEGATNSYTAILAPQTITAGKAMIDVMLSNGSAYRYTAATGGHIFATGIAYTMNLKVGKDKLEIDGNVEVSDWGTVAPEDDPFADGGEASENKVIGYFSGNLIEVNDAGEPTVGGGYWRRDTKLVVADEDVSTSMMQWATAVDVTNITDRWDGKGNTLALYQKNVDGGTTYPAATAAIKANADYSNITSVTDANYVWYLPAQNQLMAMWVTNEYLTDNGAFKPLGTDYYYWSATENVVFFDGAWFISFNNGITDADTKDSSYRVRLVRDIIVP